MASYCWTAGEGMLTRCSLIPTAVSLASTVNWKAFTALVTIRWQLCPTALCGSLLSTSAEIFVRRTRKPVHIICFNISKQGKDREDRCPVLFGEFRRKVIFYEDGWRAKNKKVRSVKILVMLVFPVEKSQILVDKRIRTLFSSLKRDLFVLRACLSLGK